MASSPPGPLRRARRPSLRDWADVAAAVRLARARRQHARAPTTDLLRRMQGDSQGGRRNPELAARIARAIPRAAARVPWRSDCLIQAMAARDWLAAHGAGSDLFIGVRTDAPGGFAAHAWLRHGDITVTGGDFAAYRPILTPETALPGVDPCG